MSYELRACKERWPIGKRVSVNRFRWIDADNGLYQTSRIEGIVVAHWAGPGVNVLCDDGIIESGKPHILDVREADTPAADQTDLFSTEVSP